MVVGGEGRGARVMFVGWKREVAWRGGRLTGSKLRRGRRRGRRDSDDSGAVRGPRE